MIIDLSVLFAQASTNFSVVVGQLQLLILNQRKGMTFSAEVLALPSPWWKPKSRVSARINVISVINSNVECRYAVKVLMLISYLSFMYELQLAWMNEKCEPVLSSQTRREISQSKLERQAELWLWQGNIVIFIIYGKYLLNDFKENENDSCLSNSKNNWQ